ncbi:unnamed protein product [Enterobius vermicularis]|uniref:Anoctamin n=1 Tax=Enterobius vermicularis TaxID=51028 RepID=A0A0N4V1M5_ENTVE|nr:unnamed protein product [Enterobius vermicularis]
MVRAAGWTTEGNNETEQKLIDPERGISFIQFTEVEIYGLYRRRKDELLESEGIMRVYVCECVCVCVLQFTDVLWFPPAFNEERKHGSWSKDQCDKVAAEVKTGMGRGGLEGCVAIVDMLHSLLPVVMCLFVCVLTAARICLSCPPGTQVHWVMPPVSGEGEG